MTIRTTILLAAVALGLSFAAGYAAHRPNPSVAQAVAHAQTVRDSVQSVRVDTVVMRRDSVVTKWLDRWHVTRDSVHDTIPIHDTAWVRAAITTCDSLASSCAAFRDTARVQHILDTVVQHDLRAELALAHQRPSFLHQITVVGATFLMGSLTGYLARGSIRP